MATPAEWADAQDIVSCVDCFREFDRLTHRRCPDCAAVNAAHNTFTAHLKVCRHSFKNCAEHRQLYATLTAAEDARRQHTAP